MMIKKIFTGLLVVTMALNVTSSLTAFAKGNTSKVTIKTVPPQEWLDEGNYEFSVEFSGDKTKHAFLDKDNGFENTVELTMMQSYTVSFSDEVANYEIGGIDTDFFIPDKEEMTVVLSFKGSGNIAKTNDDGKISEEQAERLAEARTVMRTLLENEDVNTILEKHNGWNFLEDVYKQDFYDNSNPRFTPEIWETMSEKEKYIYIWTTGTPELDIKYDKPNLTDEEICEEYDKDTAYNDENEREIMAKAIKPIWIWLYNQYQEYGDAPNLYVVYMDMKNDVQYEVENGETTENITTDNETKEKINDEKLTSKSENMVDSKMESRKTDNSDSSVVEEKKPNNDEKKSNAPLIIGGILAVIAVGAAAFLLGKRSKK